ncbi:hypothetical protein PVAP13_2NG563340 [Panicum virgatum]|uniref:Uncharacterized protein n=1 Tax=Panicum virgatum TaxID=38727 RepID=A0A8T0VMJ1_PANVG|nr:hypothetical protein PVAP13_2NG563340 [Panicum virgatum]
MLEGLEFCWCRGIPIFYNIVTSLFEWKQDLVDELLEPTTHILKHISSREELFKDKAGFCFNSAALATAQPPFTRLDFWRS